VAVFIGAAGGMLATVPVQLVLPHIGWRGTFWALAGMALLVAAWIRLSVPLAAPGHVPPPRRRLGAEIGEFKRIFAHPEFIRFMPAIALLSGLVFTYQGLWAGPWLRDVGSLGDAARAHVLLAYALGMMLGNLISGQLASMAQRRGREPMLIVYAGMVVQLVVEVALLAAPAGEALLALLWFGFAFSGSCGPVSYSLIAQRFPPALVGRVATVMNGSMLLLVFVLQNAIGWVLDMWPRTAAGGWDPAGYGWALAMTLGLQALATAWLAWRR
jgi:predicted MFS family arabinose efflux permease